MIQAPRKHPFLNGAVKAIVQAIVPTALGAMAGWVLSIENRTQMHHSAIQRIDKILQEREDKLDQLLERMTQLRLDVARVEERLLALLRK